MLRLNLETQQEFICEIIEHFENFLDAKGIELDNPEKQEAIDAGEEEDSIANIYGTDYGWLQSDIEGSLKSWGLVEEGIIERVDEKPQRPISMFIIVEGSGMDSYRVVYHRDTKVMYAVSCGTYNTGNFTVLVNPDGSPMIWEGD